MLRPDRVMRRPHQRGASFLAASGQRSPGSDRRTDEIYNHQTLHGDSNRLVLYPGAVVKHREKLRGHHADRGGEEKDPLAKFACASMAISLYSVRRLPSALVLSGEWSDGDRAATVGYNR